MTPLFCPLGCLFFSLWPLMTPLSFVYWVVCPSLYDLWWPLSLWSILLSVFLFMASDDPFLFGPLGCLSFSLWPLMTPFKSLLSIRLSVLLYMASDDPFLFCPLGCLSFSLWPLMTPFPFFHWVVCPSSRYGLWWTLCLLSIGLSVLLFMASDDPSLFCPLGCLSFFSLWPLMTPFSFVYLGCPSFFSLWPLMSPFSFVHWVVCPSLYGLWWALSLFSIGLSVLLFMTSDEPFLFCSLGCLPFFSLCPLMTLSLWSIGLSVLFMTSDDLFLFCPLGCLSFSLWPLMTTFSFVHWVVCPSHYDLWWPLSFVHWVVCSSLYDLWWPLSLWSIGLSVFLFMASDDPFLFCPLSCLFFSLWSMMTPLPFVYWVVCPSLYDLLWPLSLWSIGLSVLLLFMASDDPFHFCPLSCLSFSLLPLMSPFSFVHWLVCLSSLYDLWWPLSLLSIGLSVPLFMASDEPILFCPLGCLSFFSLWPLMTPFSLCHWVVCPSLYDLWWPLSLLSIGLSVLHFMASDDPFSVVHWIVCSSSLYGLWWPLSLWSIGLSVLLFMASDDSFLFGPLGCLSSLWPLMTPFSFVHWVVCPSLFSLWWPLSLLSIGLSVLLIMTSDDPSLLSIGLSVLLFMASDDTSLFCLLGCLSFSLWPLMTPFSLVHFVVCLSLYGLWWSLSLWSIGLSVLLFMTSDDPVLFCPFDCLSFSIWPLMTPFSFVHWVVYPSLYDLWWPLSLFSIGLSALLLVMASDEPFVFCPLGCLSFSLWPRMTPLSFVHWVVSPSSLYGLWWPLSLLSIWVVRPSSLYGLWWALSLLFIGLSVLLFMASDEPFLFFPLGCLSFSLWPLMSPFSFVHWVVCPSSLYVLWWPSLFGPLGCLSSLWPLMTPFSFVHWVVCPSLYGLWWPLSLLSIGLSVLLIMTSDDPSLLSIGLSVLLFMTSDDPFLFGPLGCLSFSLWPLMTPFSFVHWVVCSSLYGLWWHLSLLSIGLSVLLFMTSYDPFLFGPFGCLSFSLWPLMIPFSLVHWVVFPSLYDLWWPRSLLSIGLSVLLFMSSDDPFLFCPLGCLSFSLWPLMTPFPFFHWDVCPSSLYGLWWILCLLSIWVVCPSLYGLWWPLSLLSIGLSVLLLFMASDDPFLFCLFGLSVLLLFMASDEPFLFFPFGCLSFSLWPLMSPFSFVHWVVCPSSLYGLWWPFSLVHWVACPLYDLWWPLSLLSIGLSVLFMASDDHFLFCPLGCLSFSWWPLMIPLFCPLGCLFFSLWPLMTPFSLVHWVVCLSFYGLWWPLSLWSIGMSVLLFMTSDDPVLFCPLDCLSFSLCPLMTPFSFVHWVVCPSLYDLWLPLSLFSIGLSALLLFMASDEPFLFCPLGCLSFSLWPLMTPLSFVHLVVCPSSLYGLWWPLSLLSIWVIRPSSLYGLWWALSLLFIGLSVILFMASDEPFLFVHWVVCSSSLYGLWWPISLLSIELSVPLFITSDVPCLFCPLACLPFLSLWPLMTSFSFVHWVVCPFSLYDLWWPLSLCHWVVCPSLYDLWWPLSLLSIGLSVLLFMASDDPFSVVHWIVCSSSLYGLWWPLSPLSIALSVLLFMAFDDSFLFGPLGCLSSLWPLMTPFSFVHWVVYPSLNGLWWPLSLLFIGLSVLLIMISDDTSLLSIRLSVLLFMASDDTSLFCLLGCMSFSLWPLMTPFSLVHWVVCLSLYGLWWPLSLWSIGLSVLLFMTSDDLVLFCPLDCLSFSLCPLMTPFSFVHWVVYPSLYDLWWPLSLFSIGLYALLLFMASDEPFAFCPLGCLSFFLWPLITPFSFFHWVVCPSSLYGLWWPLSLLSIWVVRPSSLYGLWWALSLCSLGCLSFSVWPLMSPFSFFHWVVCPSLYDLCWALSLLFIGLSALLLFMASDEPFLFCSLGCLSFSLWPLMSPFSFFHWVVCPSLYDLWWALSLLFIGLSALLLFMASDDPSLFVHWVVCPLYDIWRPLFLLSIGLFVLLLFMASDDPFLFCPLGCLSFSLWPLMIPFSFVHWVVCPSSFYCLWWNLSLLSIWLSVLLLCMASDEPFLFCPLGCLSFFFLWPLMTTFSFVHLVVCLSLYDLWWPFSLLSIGLSVLFMASDDPFLFCPSGCLPFFSLWPLMTPFSFFHWVFCPSSLYGLWWPLSLLSIGLSVLFMASYDPFLFCPLGCLPFFSLWPLMNPFSFVHWVVYPSSLYCVWWALSLLSIGLSVLLFMTSDDEPFLFCPSGCLSFSSWPLITLFSFVHWVVCPSLYDLWWPLSLFSIGLSVLLLFMASDDPFLFCPLACLPFFSLWPLMSPFSLSIGLSVLLFMTSDDPFLFSPLGCLPFFSLWPLMTPFSFVHWLVCLLLFMTPDDPFLFVHWVVCPSLYDLWWPLSLLSNGLSALLLFMASDDPFLFCPLGCLSFFSLWPLMTHFTFVHWVVCPSLYDLWCPLSLLSIGLSVLLFMTSDDPFLFSPLGCLPFFSLWPLMTPFSFVHWLVCPSSLYDLWWPLSLLSIGLSVLLLFMTSYDPFHFVSLGCLSFSL